jgi:hypothetical protein
MLRSSAVRVVPLSLAALLVACSSSSSGSPPGTAGEGGASGGDGSLVGDGTASGEGGSGHADGGAFSDATTTDGAGVGDGGGSNDGGAPHDGAAVGDAGSDAADASVASSQGACTPGAVQCSPGNLVESCNASGTAWLVSESCASGCASGLCTGSCTPGATRCNGASVETCNAGGTAFAQTSNCTTFCAPQSAACAVAPVQITTNTTMDGVVVVNGDLVVYPGATLASPTGDLTLYAKTITVQQGGSIVVAATGHDARGTLPAAQNVYMGAGGSYGSAGASGTGGQGTIFAAPAFGSSVDSNVDTGSAGETTTYLAQTGAPGGGVLRLYASTITIAGTVSANGANGPASSNCEYGAGGGSGGGVLLAADSVAISGAVSTLGGKGGQTCGSETGDGGQGRIKVLSGASSSVTGILSGVVTQGLLPPTPLTSSSHPDPTQIYNDNFPTFDFSWAQPFPSVQGYYLLGSTSLAVPSPANAQFSSKEFFSLAESALPGFDGPDGGIDAGPGTGSFTFYFQVAPINASSTVGTVETVYPVHVNSTPPDVTSSSHPTQTAWSSNANPFFAWTFPVADSALSATYYVFDHFGDTVPGTTATLLPVGQKSQLLSNVADGVWVFHLISQDTRGYFTKVAGSYRVNIGADPGSGSLVGQVFDASAKPVVGATVTVNRGIYSTTTNSSGTYNFSAIPAIGWEVSASFGGITVTGTGSVTSGGTTTTNLTL